MVDDEVRDLTDAEYDATYAEGEPHSIPADILADAIAAANEASKLDD